MLFGGKLPGLTVDGAEHAQSKPLRRGQRKPGIEPYMRRARHQGAVREPRILERIRHDRRLGVENRMGAKCHVARRLGLSQSHLGFEPLPGFVHQGDHRDGNLTNICRQSGDVVVSLFRRGVQDVIITQGGQPLGLVLGYWGFHARARALSKSTRESWSNAYVVQSFGAEYASPCASATALCVILPSITLRPLMSAGCSRHASASP